MKKNHPECLAATEILDKLRLSTMLNSVNAERNAVAYSLSRPRSAHKLRGYRSNCLVATST
ncbi:hypothetical protein AltI4_00300 [Alteromonas sp. I4]|nr:hypothetical protein AltI4_00300 [Alteromonas sp. I4]